MSHLFHQKRDAYTVFLLTEGGSALFFSLVFTVNMVYQATTVGLNPLQLVLVGTLLETTVFLFEVPTGIVADVVSRRLSVIIGVFLMGAGFLVEGSFPSFVMVLLCQVLWGLGATFISGAGTAWIADELGEERAGAAFVRGAQIGQIGGLIGIPISAGLGAIAIQLPILLGGALFVLLGVYLVIAMPETGFTPTPAEDRTTWETMLDMFRDRLRAVRGRVILLIFMGVTIFYGLSSEGFDRLWTPHFLDNFTFPAGDWIEPVIWFGIIRGISSICGIAATEIVRRKVNTTDQDALVRTLLGMNVLTVTGLLVFALAGHFYVALAAYLVVRIMRGTGGPLVNAWINPHVESKVRATVFSMAAQMDAIGQIGGGPVVGWIGTQFSLRAALTVSSLILSPVVVLYAYARRVTRRLPLVASVTVEG